MEEAAVDYKKAIELKPGYASAYENLGIIYRNLGRNSLAKEYLSKAMELFRARGKQSEVDNIEKLLRGI